MDIFNKKRIEALEARIAALEPKPLGQYDVQVTVPEKEKSLEERVKAIEDEVMAPKSYPHSIFRIFFEDHPEKLTLRRKVERICEHLKIQFVTEPQRTVIKPVKARR